MIAILCVRDNLILPEHFLSRVLWQNRMARSSYLALLVCSQHDNVGPAARTDSLGQYRQTLTVGGDPGKSE